MKELKLKRTRDHQSKPIMYLDVAGCWKCVSHSSANEKSGYRRICIAGKHVAIHRVVYEDFIGAIDEGKVIMHACDNQWCINPKHLSQGSYQNNSDDMVSKNRQAKGESNGVSKLNNSKVLRIFKSTENYRLLGKKYGITKRNILDIKKGIIWGHLTKGMVPGRRKYNYKKHATKHCERDPKTGRFFGPKDGKYVSEIK